MYLYIYVCICTNMYTPTCIYVYIHTLIYIYICTYNTNSISLAHPPSRIDTCLCARGGECVHSRLYIHNARNTHTNAWIWMMANTRVIVHQNITTDVHCHWFKAWVRPAQRMQSGTTIYAIRSGLWSAAAIISIVFPRCFPFCVWMPLFQEGVHGQNACVEERSLNCNERTNRDNTGLFRVAVYARPALRAHVSCAHLWYIYTRSLVDYYGAGWILNMRPAVQCNITTCAVWLYKISCYCGAVAAREIVPDVWCSKETMCNNILHVQHYACQDPQGSLSRWRSLDLGPDRRLEPGHAGVLPGHARRRVWQHLRRPWRLARDLEDRRARRPHRIPKRVHRQRHRHLLRSMLLSAGVYFALLFISGPPEFNWERNCGW